MVKCAGERTVRGRKETRVKTRVRGHSQTGNRGHRTSDEQPRRKEQTGTAKGQIQNRRLSPDVFCALQN